MSDASDIFEKLLLMMLMNDMVEVSATPIITVDEAEILKAEKMYEKKESS